MTGLMSQAVIRGAAVAALACAMAAGCSSGETKNRAGRTPSPPTASAGQPTTATSGPPDLCLKVPAGRIAELDGAVREHGYSLKKAVGVQTADPHLPYLIAATVSRAGAAAETALWGSSISLETDNAEYLPQLAAYVGAVEDLGFPYERVLFELPARALQLDLAVLDDAQRVVVLGEAKRSAGMLDRLLDDVVTGFRVPLMSPLDVQVPSPRGAVEVGAGNRPCRSHPRCRQSSARTTTVAGPWQLSQLLCDSVGRPSPYSPSSRQRAPMTRNSAITASTSPAMAFGHRAAGRRPAARAPPAAAGRRSRPPGSAVPG